MTNPLNKLFSGLKPQKKVDLSGKILRLNNITVLTLDERWNVLFTNIEKTPAIIKCEEKINNYMKEQAKLTAEQNAGAFEKKALLNKIMELSAGAEGDESEEILKRIDECREKVETINTRQNETEERLLVIPDDIRDANRELLENMVSYLYYNMRKAHKRVLELDVLIESARNSLLDYIEEREVLSTTYNDAYSSFHDLIGADQISELDKFFGVE